MILVLRDVVVVEWYQAGFHGRASRDVLLKITMKTVRATPNCMNYLLYQMKMLD